MSYRKKKMRAGKLHQFTYTVGLLKRALLKWARVLFQRRSQVRLPQVARIMELLRRRNQRLRPNNQKIDDWVDGYIQQCILKGQGVEILTQWCLSKDLEARFRAQGNQFTPLEGEVGLLMREIPEIIRIFTDNGVRVNWWVTFNGAFLDRCRVTPDIANQYMAMISGMCPMEGVVFLDWEREMLGGARPKPSDIVLAQFGSTISQKAFNLDFANLLRRVRRYPDFSGSEDSLREELKYKVACEAEEGRFLFGVDSPFPCGQFILVPLEFPERYVFFAALAPEFKKRIMAIARPYPWRMDAESLTYEL